MGFTDWDGPVRLTQLAEGVTLVSHAYEEPFPSAGPADEPAAEPARKICERCELPYRVCECCNICEATCADYCEHEGDSDDD